MAFRPFIGWSQKELETSLRSAQDDYAAGKTLSSVNGGDAGSSKLVQMNPEQRIKAILYELFLVDPDTYPASAQNRVTRTQVKFSGYADGTYSSS